jgi:hypothetical protein
MHGAALSNDRQLQLAVFSSVMQARTFMLHSMPVPVMMPSLIAACGD